MTETADDYEVYLMHHGVKGMKWGIRKTEASSGSAGSPGKIKQALGSPELRAKAQVAGKVAFTAARFGLPPVLAATGVGVPIVAGLSVSMKLISDPAIKDAISSASSYSASVLKDVGSTSMKAIETHKPDVTIKNPFTTKVVTREAGANNPVFKKVGDQFQMKANDGSWVQVDRKIVESGLTTK